MSCVQGGGLSCDSCVTWKKFLFYLFIVTWNDGGDDVTRTFFPPPFACHFVNLATLPFILGQAHFIASKVLLIYIQLNILGIYNVHWRSYRPNNYYVFLICIYRYILRNKGEKKFAFIYKNKKKHFFADLIIKQVKFDKF